MEPPPATPRRLIALGASNLTRGFSTVVHAARAAWGDPLEVFAALGHGRSYGAWSRIPFRELPGILESELWEELDRRPALPTRALVTDVGNDVLYGSPVETVLSWVEEAVDRLSRLTLDVVVTDLPLWRARTLSRPAFELFRAVVVPSCHLTLAQARERAERVAEGIVALARRRGLTLVRMRREWYGFDPIHVRPRFWREAWHQVLFAPDAGAGPLPDSASRPASPRLRALQLYLAPPRRRRLFGLLQEHGQPCLRLRSGTALWLY